MYTLHVISLKFTGNPCKISPKICLLHGFPTFNAGIPHSIPVKSIPCKYYYGNQSVEIWKLQGFEIPALWFPCKVPAIPCKHLQCTGLRGSAHWCIFTNYCLVQIFCGQLFTYRNRFTLKFFSWKLFMFCLDFEYLARQKS